MNQLAALDGLPPPPLDFEREQRELWAAITNSRPASAWTASDVVLLRLYVQALGDVAQLDNEIANHGPTLGDKVHPAVKVRALRESFALALGMKLKLMPSNRYDAKTVARLGNHAAKARAGRAAIDADADHLLAGTSTKGSLQ